MGIILECKYLYDPKSFRPAGSTWSFSSSTFDSTSRPGAATRDFYGNSGPGAPKRRHVNREIAWFDWLNTYRKKYNIRPKWRKVTCWSKMMLSKSIIQNDQNTFRFMLSKSMDHFTAGIFAADLSVCCNSFLVSAEKSIKRIDIVDSYIDGTWSLWVFLRSFCWWLIFGKHLSHQHRNHPAQHGWGVWLTPNQLGGGETRWRPSRVETYHQKHDPLQAMACGGPWKRSSTTVILELNCFFSQRYTGWWF